MPFEKYIKGFSELKVSDQLIETFRMDRNGKVYEGLYLRSVDVEISPADFIGHVVCLEEREYWSSGVGSVKVNGVLSSNSILLLPMFMLLFCNGNYSQLFSLV